MLTKILRAIDGSRQIIGGILGPILDFIDSRMVIRRIITIVVLWQLVDVYLFAKEYALRSGMNGLELGAVLTALTLPVTALQAFMFKAYDDARRSDKEAH